MTTDEIEARAAYVLAAFADCTVADAVLVLSYAVAAELQARPTLGAAIVRLVAVANEHAADLS